MRITLRYNEEKKKYTSEHGMKRCVACVELYNACINCSQDRTTSTPKNFDTRSKTSNQYR